MNPIPELIWIRHGEVEPSWKGICYGAMDVKLSELGIEQSKRLAEVLCHRWKPLAIFHSGLLRTQVLAEEIARLCNHRPTVQMDTRLRERDYGDWQGMSWDEAYSSDPENFHGLVEAPDTFRPPNGETTTEMQNRVVAWLLEWTRERPKRVEGPVIVATHSGPIASLAGYLLGLHASDWGPWIVRNLEGVAVDGIAFDGTTSCTLLRLLQEESRP